MFDKNKDIWEVIYLFFVKGYKKEKKNQNKKTCLGKLF